MSLTQSFNTVLTKHQDAVKSIQSLEKISKIITAITKVVTDAGYKSVEAFYADVEAINSGAAPKVGGAKRGPKPGGKKRGRPAKTDGAPVEKKAGGKRPRFTPEQKAEWKEIYLGEAKGGLKEVERILKAKGVKVSYQTLFNEKKAAKWGDYAAPAAATA